MIYDGLVFFVALTAVNTMNLILYRQPNPAAQVCHLSGLFRSSLPYNFNNSRRGERTWNVVFLSLS